MNYEQELVPMGVDHCVVCGDAPPPSSPCSGTQVLRLHLDGQDDEHRLTLEVDAIRRQMYKDVSVRFRDLLDIATYIYAADQAIRRGAKDVETLGSAWRRRFHFLIPVRDFEFWRSDDITELLRDTVGFLSDDRYEFTFSPFREQSRRQPLFRFNDDGALFGFPEQVVMYSGGLDSLGGAVEEAVRQKRVVVLVNHRATQKMDIRYRKLRDGLDAHAPNSRPIHIRVTVNKKRWMNQEPTQRSRSFLYVALGATIAEMLGKKSVRFYENGVVSLNLPICAHVVGGKATRTTHPRVIHGFKALLSQVAGRPFHIENPFEWLTKGEVAEQIAKAGCAGLIVDSISCTHTWELTNEHPHCGYCSQCIDRRFAILSKGLEQHDPPDQYKMNCFTESRSRREYINEDKTLLASYLERANQVVKCEGPMQFLRDFPEIARTLRYMQGDAGIIVQRCHDLYLRHSAEVNSVVERMISQHSTAIRERSLPADAMLRVVIESTLPTSVPAHPESQETLPDNVFRLSGGAWQVRYRGGKSFVVLPWLGASYLHYLLSAPNKSRPAIDMVCKAAVDFCSHAMSSKEAIEAGLRSSTNPLLERLDNVSDWQAVREYRDQGLELLIAIEEARRDNNNVLEQQFENDLAVITARINESVGIGGKLKQAQDKRKSIRDSFRNNVKRVIDRQIRQPDPELAAHLDEHVVFGNSPRYVQAEGLTWETEPTRND